MTVARIAAVLFAASLSAIAGAQQPAQAPQERLSIKVVDPTSAMIPGAQVVVDHTDTATDSGGNASITLPTGTHEIRVSAPGFATNVQKIEVRDSSDLQITVTLNVGGVWCGPCVTLSPVSADGLASLPQLESVEIAESIPLRPFSNLDPLPSRRPKWRW
jgi:hypothetical protein